MLAFPSNLSLQAILWTTEADTTLKVHIRVCIQISYRTMWLQFNYLLVCKFAVCFFYMCQFRHVFLMFWRLFKKWARQWFWPCFSVFQFKIWPEHCSCCPMKCIPALGKWSNCSLFFPEMGPCYSLFGRPPIISNHSTALRADGWRRVCWRGVCVVALAGSCFPGSATAQAALTPAHGGQVVLSRTAFEKVTHYCTADQSRTNGNKDSNF